MRRRAWAAIDRQLDFGPSTPNPPRILCLGVNYADHAIEGGRAVPTWPESFVRGAGSVIGAYDDMVKPTLSERLDYEAELAIIIGKGGRYIKAEDAFDAILGYSVMNDGSAREWQRAATQWTPGKNFEGTMPIGPELVTNDEVDVTDLAISIDTQRPRSCRISAHVGHDRQRRQARSSTSRRSPPCARATSSRAAHRVASASRVRHRSGCCPVTRSRLPSRASGLSRTTWWPKWGRRSTGPGCHWEPRRPRCKYLRHAVDQKTEKYTNRQTGGEYMGGMSLTSSGGPYAVRFRRKITWLMAALVVATVAVGLPGSTARARELQADDSRRRTVHRC